MRCPKCAGSGVVERAYLLLTVLPNLVEQTPREVWQGYLASGYTIHEALAEELSYGDQGWAWGNPG